MPNQYRWDKGKSFTKFTFTYLDIANATNLTVTTVREYARRKVFNPHDLTSLVLFIKNRL